MERLVETKMSIFSQLVKNPSYSIDSNQFRIYPQMPRKQIQHYLKRASHQKSYLIIQLKPSAYSDYFVEVSGTITLSPKSSHIILTPSNDQMTHLIQAKHIHHIRLA